MWYRVSRIAAYAIFLGASSVAAQTTVLYTRWDCVGPGEPPPSRATAVVWAPAKGYLRVGHNAPPFVASPEGSGGPLCSGNSQLGFTGRYVVEVTCGAHSRYPHALAYRRQIEFVAGWPVLYAVPIFHGEDSLEPTVDVPLEDAEFGEDVTGPARCDPLPGADRYDVNVKVRISSPFGLMIPPVGAIKLVVANGPIKGWAPPE